MIRKLNHFLTFAVVFAVSSFLPLGAVTLESLLGSSTGGGLVVGNVDYYDFGFSTSCFEGNHGVSCASLGSLVSGIDPNGISVDPATGLPTGEQGFEITSPLSVTSNGQDVKLDISLTYDAAVVGSGSLFDDLYLAGADSFNPPGGCHPTRDKSCPGISVGETVSNLTNGDFLGKLEIQDPPATLSDQIFLTPSTASISVVKDIKLESGSGFYKHVPDSASLTTLIQATSLTSMTPEPRAYALLLAGFFGAFVAISRRRRQTDQTDQTA